MHVLLAGKGSVDVVLTRKIFYVKKEKRMIKDINKLIFDKRSYKCTVG
jgi:hypothetical protein